MNVKQKLTPVLGLQRKARDARTAADHQGVLADIKAKITASDARLAALDAKHRTIFFNGGDEAELLAEMSREREISETLRLNRETAEHRLAEARANENTQALEASAQHIHDAVVSELEAAFRENLEMQKRVQ